MTTKSVAQMRWIDRIKRAEKRGEFNATDRQLSRSYATCATGERIADLIAAGVTPRTTEIFDGGYNVVMPERYQIMDHAIMFHSYVLSNKPRLAAEKYAAIQAWDGSA